MAADIPAKAVSAFRRIARGTGMLMMGLGLMIGLPGSCVIAMNHVETSWTARIYLGAGILLLFGALVWDLGGDDV